MTTPDERGAILTSRKHWFIDLDGTVYLEGEALPGVGELLVDLAARGAGWTFLTNNSSRSSEDFRRRLDALGLPLGRHGVYTSGRATGAWLRAERPEARVFLLGTQALAAELRNAGVRVVNEDPDLVVVGYDTSLTYERLARACLHLHTGAGLVATHPDVTCPTPDGPVPDAGSFLALIEAATGRRPERVIGKPNVEVLQRAAEEAGVPVADCAVVGDRLETDMTMAREAGATAVLVLTGATSADDPRLEAEAWRSWLHVVSDLTELRAQLARHAYR